MNPNPNPKNTMQCRPRIGLEAGTYLYSIAKVLGGNWDIARGGGGGLDGGGGGDGRALHGAEKDGGGRESGVGRATQGRIKMLGAGEVFLPEPADSYPSWTAELACHASKSGKCVLFFSPCC